MFVKLRSFLFPPMLVLSVFASPFVNVGLTFGQAPAVQEDVQSQTGVVVSASTYASDVGAEILRQGEMRSMRPWRPLLR